jgi:hypothetical protein
VLWIIFAAAGFACNSNKSVNIRKKNIYDKIVGNLINLSGGSQIRD